MNIEEEKVTGTILVLASNSLRNWNAPNCQVNCYSASFL